MRPPTPKGLPKKRRWDWVWYLLIAAAVAVALYASERFWPHSGPNLKARVDDHEQRLRALEGR